jgi:signal peptidase II
MWLIDAKTQFQRLCYILVIGGALGNIIDRLRFGAVMDFLDVHVAGYHWPAFNVADSAVVIGITMLIGGLMVVDNKRKASSKKRLKERQKNRAKYLRSY